ncbi:NAD-dependent epimerase/dehydratase family protein [Clostridium algidicarnis]|uniref:NAD-dependent epimerase/dehydratase family protein n=1 Tax=Clostridium algidicarnis TaxID=37659 RepID=UPI001FD45BD3|nr:NAD-dependent epimerase/dehydratase family protein [Clostridium algidicarnis]
MKKVLIMGGSYFIGKKIVDGLLNNSYSVYALNRGTKENDDERVINLKCDRNDAEQMKIILSNYLFDIVIDVSALNKSQVEILYNSLNKENLKQFVFISSSAVYDVDNFSIPYSEETPMKENKYWTSYGTNKIEAENFLKEKFEDLQLNLIILRPSYVYGENNYAQRESFIFEHICNEKPIIIPNNGEIYLQFIYTTDLANIILELINTKLDKISIFNLGNKKPITIKEWIECCANVVGKKAKIIQYDYDNYNRKEREFFPFFNYNNVLDVSKINELYHRETDFLIGLKNAFHWYCNNKHKILFKDSVKQNEETILRELNPKIRFSNRVENYVKFRPSYPNEVIDFLRSSIGLNEKSIIADIGSGTGLATKLFLDNGNIVYGLEPNLEMRQAAEEVLASYSSFFSIDSSSENTMLQSEHIDVIVAAQAFHWFDPKPTKEEFLRILKPGGVVVLLVNRRKRSNDKFMNGYMEIVWKYGQPLNIKADSESIADFFYPNNVHEKVFYNPYTFNFDRLKGELMSYSYMPNEQDPKFKSMISELELLFEKYNDNGTVILQYETVLYYCKMK